MDRLTKSQRSLAMSRVKAKDTSSELMVRSILHRRGFRFRLDRRDLPGRPDIILPRYNLAIFVHGCFWHGHDCPKGRRRPLTNTAYWDAKLDRNIERDRQACEALTALGWKVRTVWTCHIAADVDQIVEYLEEEKARAGR